MAVEVKSMELKKTQQVAKPASVQAKDIPAKSIQMRDFLGDIKAEFSKISWTSPDELRSYTKIVVLTTIFFGMGIYFMDVVIQMVLGTLEYIMRLIG